MNNEIQIFNYGQNDIAVIMVDGEPWWIAKDVCDVLDLTNPTEAIRALDSDERNTLRISEGIRGNPNVNIINEPGLYSLIIRSNKPEAKKFKRWITHEVLPTIRKTGGYVASDVVKILGYKIPKDAISVHCRGAVKHRLIDSLGRQQLTSIIPERDVYWLVLRSKLPTVEKFEDWVTLIITNNQD